MSKGITPMAKVLERKGHRFIMDRRDPEAFDGACELCGAREELRPYGPRNENICFDCMMKDEATAQKKFAEFFSPQ